MRVVLRGIDSGRLRELRGIGPTGQRRFDGAQSDHAGAQVAALIWIFAAAGPCSGASRAGGVFEGAGAAGFFGRDLGRVADLLHPVFSPEKRGFRLPDRARGQILAGGLGAVSDHLGGAANFGGFSRPGLGVTKRVAGRFPACRGKGSS